MIKVKADQILQTIIHGSLTFQTVAWEKASAKNAGENLLQSTHKIFATEVAASIV